MRAEFANPDQAELIAQGRHTEACDAIGRANTATLRLAADLCEKAAHAALATMQPASGYRQRRQFCRERLRRIAPDNQPQPHTVRL